ncbi:PQQ-binding-like beta-propeller repeat protein [Streptomyces sp. NPDC088116]|uniref:outer membrane protein assembly factor BamB family protein n=1 Tax=Streptomyces sp. NPDC088116 TaxID=3365825 RepID=UPI003830F098
MTHPPGREPPQEGFGPPQEPPQGQQPWGPQQWGPQPGPYSGRPGPYGGAQPGPYGSPQPGPYNSPPGPYGTPVPGPHNAPTVSYGSTGSGSGGSGAGGGRNPFKGKPRATLAAVVAGLLVLGGGTWFALSGDGDDGDRAGREAKPKVSSSGPAAPSGSPAAGDSQDSRKEADGFNAVRKDGEATVEWLHTNDMDLPGVGADSYGPWFAGDTVVKATYRQVVGYSTTDGTKKWTFPLPAEACVAPAAPTPDGKIVIGFKGGASESAACDQMQMIDLTTGQGGWRKEIPEAPGAYSILDVTMAISGNTVTAGHTGYRVSDGKKLFGRPPGDCFPYAFAGGAKLIAAEDCPSGRAGKQLHQLQELDPATGKVKWTHRVKKDLVIDKIYSVDPLVFSVKHQEDGGRGVFVLNADGTERSQPSGSDDQFRMDCDDSAEGVVPGGQPTQEGCIGVVAGASTLYMSTSYEEGSDSHANAIVAFDLATGKLKWRATSPDDRMMTPVRMEGGNLLAYLAPWNDKAGGVVTIAPTGGAPRTLLRHPASTAKIETYVFSQKYAYVDGRFYVSAGSVGASDDTAEKKLKTMIVFGE